MGQVSQHFQPPLYWQQFEDLTQAAVEWVYDCPHADKIGRPGQAQSGVDVHAGRTRAGAVGVQCKRLDDLDENNQPLPGGPITRKILFEEVDKARQFMPELDLWILATTAKRDARIQKIARELDAKHRKAGLFEVKLWFWDDYVAFLNCYSDLQRGYYADVVQLRAPRDQDLVILETIATAFHRPALRDSLHVEQPDDLLVALRDTLKALRTGQLVDRQSRHVIRKAVGGWRALHDPLWRSRLQVIDETLDRTRQGLIEGLQDGRLDRSGQFMVIRDPSLRNDLEQGRRECLRQLNDVLSLAGLSRI